MYTLSIILNLHREGLLAERTIKNLRNVLDFAKKQSNNWESIEVVAVLDNPDDVTKDIVNKHKELFSKVEVVNYCDLADSRNHGVRCARNNFILFADGDDYVSHNTLVALFDKFYDHYTLGLNITSTEQLSILEENQHIAVFPELLVEFPKLFFQRYMDSNDFIKVNMQFTHCYISRICCTRLVLINNWVRANQLPYGYEDWDLNNRLLASGISYQVAPDYVLYYRKMNSASLLQNQVKNKCIVRNSDIYLLDIEDEIVCDSHMIIQSGNAQNNSKNLRHSRIGRKIKKISNKLGILQHIQKRLHNMDLKKQSRILKQNYQQVIDKHKKFLLSYSETNLNALCDNPFGDMSYLSSNYSGEVIAFDKLRKFLENKDIIFIIPWLKLGGADKVVLEYVKSLEPFSVGLITTLEPGERISELLIDYIDINHILPCNYFSDDIKSHVLIKALINSKVKLTHIVNSDLGLNTFLYYSNVYKSYGKKLITTFFAPEVNYVTGEFFGYPIKYKDLFISSDVILSDNNFWNETVYMKNVNNNYSFQKLPVPVSVAETKVKYHAKQKKILWASRFALEKTPSHLISIAKQLTECTFIIYSDLPNDHNLKSIYDQLSVMENVELRQAYSSLSELNFDEFDLFLYTSLFDGIPNVVLEMGLAGLPIIAPNIGGVSEVLGRDYYLLVNDCQNYQSYIEKLKLFYNSSEDVIKKNVSIIKTYIEKEHTADNFQSKYREIVGNLINTKCHYL